MAALMVATKGETEAGSLVVWMAERRVVLMAVKRADAMVVWLADG